MSASPKATPPTEGTPKAPSSSPTKKSKKAVKKAPSPTTVSAPSAPAAPAATSSSPSAATAAAPAPQATSKKTPSPKRAASPKPTAKKSAGAAPAQASAPAIAPSSSTSSTVGVATASSPTLAPAAAPTASPSSPLAKVHSPTIPAASPKVPSSPAAVVGGKKMVRKKMPLAPSTATAAGLASPPSSPSASGPTKSTTASVPTAVTNTTRTASITDLVIAEAPLDEAPTQAHEVVDAAEGLTQTIDPIEQVLRLESLRKTVRDFYAIVAPERLDKVAEVAATYLGTELKLFAQLEAKYRYGALPRRPQLSPTRSPIQPQSRNAVKTGASAAPADKNRVPIYPAGYLQKQFNSNLAAAAISHACREHLIAARVREQRLAVAKAKKVDPTAPPPKAKSKDAISKEVIAMLSQMPTDAQIAELSKAAATVSAPPLNVWANVALQTYATTRAEAQWDAALTDFLNLKQKQSDTVAVPPAVASTDSGVIDGMIDDETGAHADSELQNATADNSADEATLWQLVHQHHQRVRRSLFMGEVVADEMLPTGESRVRAANDAPTSVPATVLHACIGAGYASTCDVTPRQQLQALVMKYCPQNLPLLMPALWLYRGREHELITKLHAEHGLDRPADDTLLGSNSMATSSVSATAAAPLAPYVATAPNNVNSFPDPLVGSEIYLSEVMHGVVCGISREIEYDTRFKLTTKKDASSRGGAATSAPPTTTPPCAYPCEDVSFRSWSNIPPHLHATAHMARHYGLGPQFVHHLHAQNPIDASSCNYELLCALFPDAVYFCLDDDDQRLAFMTRRVSELMSFVQSCDPNWTRKRKGAGSAAAAATDAANALPLLEAVPKLFQKYSPIDEMTDEEWDRRNAKEGSGGGRFTRKPPKTRQAAGPGGGSDTAAGGGTQSSGASGAAQGPERALADAFAQHFGKELSAADQPAFPWEDMYRHVSETRHAQMLSACARWSQAYGPLPAVREIQLDILGAAAAATQTAATKATGTDDARSDDDELDLDASPSETALPDSSGATGHVPTRLADPHSPIAATTLSLGQQPSLLHRMAIQPLTRSTPMTYDSILKPWLMGRGGGAETCEVGTMTRHREEEAMHRMLHTRSVGTMIDVDELNLGDDKYRGWPIPFRYEEEYRQALAKMSVSELRRERHRALFGSRTDAGVVMFGNKGKPLPPPSNVSGINRSSQQHRSGGVRIAADGTIDLSSSPSPSRGASPSRSVGVAAAAAAADHYRLQRNYEQWFQENVGESGRGRYTYTKHLDPDREARRLHRELYFGAAAAADDDADDEPDPNYHHVDESKWTDGGPAPAAADAADDAALYDAVFGGGAQLMKSKARDGHGAEAIDALAVAHRSPFWCDHDPRDYTDATDEWLAARTDSSGLVRLVGRYREGKAALAAARDEIRSMREEMDSLRVAARGGVLSVPTLASAKSTLDHTARPRFHNDCGQCDEMQRKVDTLMERLNALRNNRSLKGAVLDVATPLGPIADRQRRAQPHPYRSAARRSVLTTAAGAVDIDSDPLLVGSPIPKVASTVHGSAQRLTSEGRDDALSFLLL